MYTYIYNTYKSILYSKSSKNNKKEQTEIFYLHLLFIY